MPIEDGEKMFTVNSGFIGHFKTGDNINYNLNSLKVMYAAQNTASPSDSLLLCKPITITLGSIIEALLHDLFFRIKNHTNEGVKNVAEKALKDVRSKKLDQLETYIASARKHDLLGAIGTGLYEQLDDLRRTRNRIHIQNVKNQKPLDEGKVFNLQKQKTIEQVLEKLLKHVSDKYIRPGDLQGFVDDFELPWNEHFKTGSVS
ncbi:hypothetical protein ACMDCT_10050 [Halomonadaceae bacterium KBTZ08]